MEEELSGYEIKKIINIRMSFFWQESYGQIYPELSKMQKEGLIDFSNTEAIQKSKREMTKYKINNEGQKVLKKWMEAENEKDTSRSEFLLKMFLSTEQNKVEMRKHILQFKEQSEQKIRLFQLFQQELTRDVEMHHNHRQILKVLDLGLRQAMLYADWSKEMLDEMKSN